MVFEAETRIQQHLEVFELDAAATVAMRELGPEILGYILALVRDEGMAGEIFSQFSLDLWAGLPTYRRRSSFRTWAYAVARNAAFGSLRRGRMAREVGLSAAGALSGLAAEVRTRTLPHLRTDVKSRMAELRARLEPDDQSLLILRIDRGLSWRELAEVFDEGGDPDRRAAALRKRFERVKAELKQLAKNDGLLEEG